jgi:hypothetical protein
MEKLRALGGGSPQEGRLAGNYIELQDSPKN